MAEPDLAQFTQHVLQSRLVDRESLASQVQSFRRSEAQQSARLLARQLVKAELLTRYQARRLLAGRTEGFFLGDCRILDRLGEGGMGVVYLAEQQKLSRNVALKVLPFRSDFQSDVLQRFQREARAAAQLKHPNIVQVYDIGCDRDTHFIVMEYVAGDTLAQLIRRQGSFSAAQSVPLIRQAAEGLAHAHQHGVIHRDIKPSNLMMEGRTLKILDLGLARLETDEQLTGDRSVMGTLDYMSPEQCEGTRHVDQRSDLYSLGCTWFHLLSGSAPFADRRGTAKLLGHMADLLPSITDVAPDTPPAVVKVLAKLTLRDRDRRYQSADELLQDLNTFDELWDQQTLVSGPQAAAVAADSGDDADESLQPASDSDEPLSPRQSDDDMTLVHRPSDGPGLLYLIPVMAALVLGGIYLGIELLKDRLPEAETIVIEVPPKSGAQPAIDEQAAGKDSLPQTAEAATESPANQPPDGAVAESNANVDGSSAVPNPIGDDATEATLPSVATTDDHNISTKEDPGESTQPSLMTDSPEKPEPPVRDAQEFVLRDVSESWLKDRVDGDTLTLLDRDHFSINGPTNNERSLTVQGSERQRAVLYVQAGDSEYFWSQNAGSLTLRFVDLYIDLRKSAGRFDVFRLSQADLFLIDSSITILADETVRWSTVSFVDAKADRPWDVTAKGEPPSPVTISISNSLLRGPGTVVRNATSQTRLEFSNTVAAVNGPILHQYNTVPLQYDHQGIKLKLHQCAVDTPESIVRIDCRPPTLEPALLSVAITNSLVLNPGGVAEPPDLMFWSSGAASSTVAASLAYAGRGNVYANRTAALSGKSIDGTRHRYVESSPGWETQRLGVDRNSVEIGLPIRGGVRQTTSRTARDHAATTILRGRRDLPLKLTEIGPDARAVAQPRRLPSSLD